jgi:carbon-monoxide dehydrogenase medium subunit
VKSAEFDYIKPASIDHALQILVQHGDDARIMAGGQTLLATLNMRLSEPAIIVDITGIPSLRGIRTVDDTLHIGALVTHTEIEESALIRQHAPMLSRAAPHIAHRAIRNAGTWGGSIAYADPAAEWPACLLALGGTVVAHGPRGERRIHADDFFVDLYTTSLAADEILVRCEIPAATNQQWSGFSELARRHGDYAIVGLAASAERSQDRLARVRLALMGVAATPFRARKTEARLEGQILDDSAIATAVNCLREEIDPFPDLTNSAAAKRQMAATLLARLLQSART